MTKSKNKKETMTRDEMIDKLYDALYEDLQDNLGEAILSGMKCKGLNNMDNEELEEEYSNHCSELPFGAGIKIVE